MSNNIKKGLMIIFMVNILNMGFKIFINLVQPAFLSLETYAMLQTFSLYCSYAGLLHFGYVDGVYLRYGGKAWEECKKPEFCSITATLRATQLFVSFVVFFIGLISRNLIICAVGMYILPANIVSYYRLVYQATGRFELYGKSVNFNTVLLALYNFLLILVFKADDYRLFLVFELVVIFIMYFLLEFYFVRNCSDKKTKFIQFNYSEFKENVKEGLPLTLGNLSSNLFTSLDRWFVKFLLTTNDFAYYSFAVSIETFMNIAISPILITLYNFFCTNDSKENVNRVKNLITIFAVFIVSAAFPAKFILINFMPNYIPSNRVLFILFSARILSIIIQGIYVNLYKAKKRQRDYLSKLFLCIIIGVVLNFIGYYIYKDNVSFAYATLATIIVWLVLSILDFKEVTYSFNDIIYIIIAIVSLNILGSQFDAIIGFVLYWAIMLASSLILEYNNFLQFITLVFSSVKVWIHKK